MNFLQTLERYKNDGYLMKQVHPVLPLTIWNYTQTTQFERNWDEITLQCRGLVTDDEGNIVARPFKKFFNIEEGEHKPTNDFSVYEKMDGSCIILFYYKGEWVVASRGSFTSEQALAAAYLLTTKYDISEFHELTEYTLMLELTAPWNRIVVDYGNEEKLTLLGMIETDTGCDINRGFLGAFMMGSGIDVVKEYDNIEDYSTLKTLVKDNQEGFVIHFSNGDRCKIKGDEYCRLHNIMTNMSTVSIWESMKNQDEVESLLLDVPDEYYDKIKEYMNTLLDGFWEADNHVNAMFKTIYREGMTSSEFSKEVRYIPQPYKSLLFSQFNITFSKYTDSIWNSIRPEYKPL